ncbi:Rv1476 family membrane protein [Corynebacterium sp. ZY180755]
MIPADVDMGDLTKQLADDQVALESPNSQLHGDLLSVVQDLSSSEFGTVGIAVLDETPQQTADLRDIAQVLLDESTLESVIVRAPSSGAIVSDVHSRADIESAQWDFLANPDYAEATRTLGDHILNNPVNDHLLSLLLIALTVVGVVASIVVTFIFARR